MFGILIIVIKHESRILHVEGICIFHLNAAVVNSREILVDKNRKQ